MWPIEVFVFKKQKYFLQGTTYVQDFLCFLPLKWKGEVFAMLGFTMIVYIDYVLLSILLFLTFFTCFYCVYRIRNLHQNGQMELLLRPTRVLFSHKKEGESTEQLRTVVAYQNPFTGDYCVRKSRVGPTGYVNALNPTSPDSGLSDEYEPLQLDPHVPQATIPKGVFSDGPPNKTVNLQVHSIIKKPEPTYGDNSLNKTWNWNYKEYQI